MAINPPLITNSLTHLNQWVKIASGDRVKLTGGISLSVNPLATNTGYFVFRCTECADNWHVGHENFQGNVQDPAAITVPSVLSDWVKKHRHVCKKFNNPPATSTGVCQSCKWPYDAHEESWYIGGEVKGMPVASGKQIQMYTYSTEGTVGTASFLKQLDKKNFSPKPADASMTLRQFTGRKFRDIEDICESPDTNTEKTSNV